jgi:hypothetical protein
MATTAFPELWIGPAGSGKLTAARKALGVPAGQQPRLLTLEIGDYAARYWEFPSHMEVDIMDLSMMDKQILPELLTQLLSTRDVTGGRRKVMILRHVHGLSPAAATRLRVCLEELVWSPGAPAMIWCTARVLNSVVSQIADGFVYRRVPGPVGGKRLDRDAVSKAGTLGVAPAAGVAGALPVPTIQTYIAETLRQMVCALDEGPRCLAAATWIRARVYDLLGLMLTGSDLVAGLTWATVRLAAAGAIKPKQAAAVLETLTRARWVPSYRTPLMLEMIVVSVYNALAASL